MYRPEWFEESFGFSEEDSKRIVYYIKLLEKQDTLDDLKKVPVMLIGLVARTLTYYEMRDEHVPYEIIDHCAAIEYVVGDYKKMDIVRKWFKAHDDTCTCETKLVDLLEQFIINYRNGRRDITNSIIDLLNDHDDKGKWN